MTREEYAERLRDPRWKSKRLEVLDERGWKCELCGAEEGQLNVHHKFYEEGAEPWEIDSRYLLCLCAKCHGEEPGNVKEAIRYLMAVIEEHGCSSVELSELANEIEGFGYDLVALTSIIAWINRGRNAMGYIVRAMGMTNE